MLGLSFLAAGARAGEHGLHFGFYESPQRLVATADQVGMPFSDLVSRKLVKIIWNLPVERILDRLAQELLAAVRRDSTRRLFIDGLSAFEQAAAHPERMAKFFTALTSELRALDVTTIISSEMRTLFGPQIEGPALGISAAVENIILLRYVELGSRLYRLISVLKARESGYDSEIREFKISSKGIEVASTFESAEAILTGVAQPLAGAHGGEER